MTDIDELYAQRRKKADHLRAIGLDPYANDFKVDCRVLDFVNLYYQHDHDAAKAVTKTHAFAGRVMAINSFGKAAFLRIQDGSDIDLGPDGQPVGRLQIYVRRDALSNQGWETFEQLDIGDIIGVTGTPMRTKTGELSLNVTNLRLLTKSLRPLPEKWHGLTDVETRYRQRYLDLLVNPHVRQVFQTRCKIVQWLRQFFNDRGFYEVETPMLQSIAGGAAAKPFTTHHNALKIPLFLRIAPELYLKRLLVGGFERVFEINRNFRNEGVSTFHNPEFTMLEFYQAYATYEDLMVVGETLLSGLCEHIHGVTTVQWGDQQINLSPPFARLTMLEAIAKYGGPTAAQVMDSQQVKLACEQVGFTTTGKSHGQLIVDLFTHYAEPKLVQPTFIYDYPADISPLSRHKQGEPQWVDRFELFVGGHELANAFSELNDPIDQSQRFAKQLAAKEQGDAEAYAADDDYVRALEHGMPPTGGFGMGIDRLVMLLTNSVSIRDVILFPLLRPEK